jgi:hypothetical protein
MRNQLLWGVALAACAVAAPGEVRAAGGCGCEAVTFGPACGCEAGAAACDGGTLGGCGRFGGCGLFGHKCKPPRFDGLDAHFNCGCNGSYKFPVPPLYTYHWPGMWQQHLMTDYHSPWRFPPLKPYRDEVFAPAETAGPPAKGHPVRTASFVSEPASKAAGGSFSRRLEALGQ